MSTQSDRAEDLADTADQVGAGEGEARRHRTWLRPSPPVVAVLVVGALVVGVTILIRFSAPSTTPVDVPPEALRLPTEVNAPGTWSDAVGPEGPLAALGLGLRTRPEGLFDEQRHLQLFGVSAVDGRATWIDLPGVYEDDRSLVGWFALSPDGQWIAWSRHEKGRRTGELGPLTGWAVMDTTTREIRNLADPDSPRLRDAMADLAFSGDSRYLLTSYETPSSPRTRGHRFVAWDVRDGTPTVLEEPGHYWLPVHASAPTGVAWARGRTVHRVDPATGEAESYSLPQSVMAASWAPDDTAFAYIGDPADEVGGEWRLYAGRTLDEARGRDLSLTIDPGQLLGWRDERHVVVGHFRRVVHVVDIVTGDVDEIDLSGHGTKYNPPLLAADLWRNPLAVPTDPADASDPRVPFRWAGGVVLVLLAGGWVVGRRRRVKA